MIEAKEIETTLMNMANNGQARLMLRFFKTGPGDYGEGDRFIGVKNPQVRMVVKQAWKETPVSEAARLVKSPLHEMRLCGLLIMVEQYLKAMKKRDNTMMKTIYDTYTAMHAHINNWDLVDLSAIKIVGNHEVLHPDCCLMDEWIKPEGHTLWQQRIAMVSTWMLIRHSRADVCFRRAEMLLSSRHDLLHKAAGWMLREAWKNGYKEELRDFLHKNVSAISSVMLAYACEQMSVNERHEWQRLRKNGRNRS